MESLKWISAIKYHVILHRPKEGKQEGLSVNVPVDCLSGSSSGKPGSDPWSHGAETSGMPGRLEFTAWSMVRRPVSSYTLGSEHNH